MWHRVFDLLVLLTKIKIIKPSGFAILKNFPDEETQRDLIAYWQKQ